MNKLSKVIVSIPSVLFLCYFPIYLIFPFFSLKFGDVVISYSELTLTMNVILVIQTGYLIIKLWKIKALDKKIKRDWTFLLIIFNSVSALIFIWTKIDLFKNKKGN